MAPVILLLLFSSCALPPWMEKIPSRIEQLPTWMEQIPSQIEQPVSQIKEFAAPWIEQFTSWLQQFSNHQPVSYIDLIKPQLVNQGDTVSLSGHGIDVDGEIVACIWRSNIDGELSIEPVFENNTLSVGDHIIYFKVQDNKGTWSEETQERVQVLGPNSDLPVISDFSTHPTDIRAGDSTTLYWNVAGATAISIEPVIGNVPPSGSRAVIIDDTTTFKLIASNAAGSISKTCNTNVINGKSTLPQSPVINYFTVGDMVIVAGEISSLSWSVSNAKSVTIEPSIGLVSPEGYLEVCPRESIEYTLTAVNSTGSVTKSVSIGVAMEEQFTVNNIQSSGSIVSERGKCPAILNFSFTITASGAGIVTYYFESSLGVITPTENLEFSKAGSMTINVSMSVSDPGKYFETLHIITPEKIIKKSQSVAVSCAETYSVIDAFCISGPLSGQRSCPSTLSYTFSITTDGPCIVFYHFERSDGAVLPNHTITFADAGTRIIDFIWTVDEPGAYWVDMIITSPNSMSAVSEVMNLTCGY